MRFHILALLLLASPLAAQRPGPEASPQPITLAEAINRGRSAGIRNTLAQIGVRQAGAKAGLLASTRLPSVVVSLSADRQTTNLDEFGLDLGFGGTTDPYSLFRGRLSVRQLLFDRAVLDRIRMARDSQVVAGDDARNVGELSAAAAGAAWLRLVSAIETVRARENDSVTAVALKDIAAAQVQAGTAARIEQTRSESQLAIIRSQLAIARLAVERSVVDLDRLLDLPAATRLVPSGNPTLALEGYPTDVDQGVALALANRSDLAAEQERADLADKSIAAIRHEFWPTAVLQGYTQSSGVDLGRMNQSWNLGLGLSWAAFDGLSRQRRIAEEQLRRDAQQARLNDLRHQIEAEARQATLDLASAAEQLELAQERVRLAEQEISEARERLTAGVTGTTETTRAQGQLTAAQDNLIQARVMLGAAQLGAAATFGLLDQIR